MADRKDKLAIVRFCRDYHDVLDADFLCDFPEVEARKPNSVAELEAAIAGAEVLHINDSFFTPEVARVLAAHGGALRWIQFTTVGTDHAQAAGLPPQVRITNVGDVRQRILAGHAIGLMLAAMRGYTFFEPWRARHEWARDEMSARTLAPDGNKMVILGMGRLGQDIARKAKAFDMEVTCVSRTATPACPWIDRVVPRERLLEVLPEADAVMIALPLDDGTRSLIGARELAAMKPTAVLVNVSRGPVVDEAALIAALRAGTIRAAGLDAFEDEPLPPDSGFWDLPNLVMTPHIGGQGGGDQWLRLSQLVRDNTRRYLDGQPLINVIREPIAGK
jgi:phosphoglycerate dehydrogenase-like enzyme